MVRLLAIVVALAAPASAAASPPARQVPVLEFHVVGDPPAGSPNPGLYVSRASFRGEVAWLALHGYHGVTLDELFRYWRSAGWLALPPRPVVLTFDDGYPQDVDVAMPVLRARRWPAVLNLQVGNLVPKRVRQLIAAGWEVDAHTFTHPDLTRVDAAQLDREVRVSRKWIEAVFGQPVDFFCYPYGRFDSAVVAAVRRAGYLGAETELPGDASSNGDPFRIHRIEVLRTDGVAGLAAKLG